MTTGHVFIATSIDGFIARQDGNIAWLENAPTAGENHGFENFMDSVDGLVMGRHTYEQVLAFDQWPYRKPVVVLSRSLSQDRVPTIISGKVHVSADTPEALMESLSRRGWKRVYVDGGQVIQSFLTAGLIEDLIITRIPVLLGSGRPLFRPLPNDIWLDHVETTAFPSGLVQSKYRVRSGD
jgi:dihydrofolate reductase